MNRTKTFFLMILISSFSTIKSAAPASGPAAVPNPMIALASQTQQPAAQALVVRPIVNPYPHAANALRVMIKIISLRKEAEPTMWNPVQEEMLLFAQSAHENLAAYSTTQAHEYLQCVNDLLNPNEPSVDSPESVKKMIESTRDPLQTYRETILKADPALSAKIAKAQADFQAKQALAAAQAKKTQDEAQNKQKGIGERGSFAGGRKKK